ncbi:hypothetical protein [Thalassotalea sp. PLHSN55]|uniref:hypothetical protein n=1 Tax=Thalassotalea sp. PLHSN55 TaxID=3435888 RepID=UPI003F864926
MGKNIAKDTFCDHDYCLFEQKLSQQLEQLKDIIEQDGFGQSTLKIGAELEMYLVDADAQVSLANQQLLNDLNDVQFQPELNQYNIELNLNCFPQQGQPFTALRNEILDKTAKLEKVAKKRGINIVPIGILPTLEKKHLNVNYMTDSTRYRCLANYLYQQRGEAFKINISGEENLSVDFDDICAEGANTSFQVHMMTKPALFCQTFNAAQLTLPLVTAIGANSAIFLGKKLWHETRVALFKQSLDIRLRDKVAWQEPPRVNFGHGWLRNGPWELFAESVALYPPVIPEVVTTKNEENLAKLDELNLHMGTVWPWHRPVYDHHNNGHIRIEFRAIPAGPTSLDMVANAAFAIGLAAGMADNIQNYLAVMPFKYAEYNFYRAAQSGLDAKILWPLNNPYKLEEVALTDVINALIPIAKQGLASLGVDNEEINQFIHIIEQRLNRHINGAIWQQNTLTYLEQTMDKTSACRELVNLYITNCRTCQPVATWEQIWT